MQYHITHTCGHDETVQIYGSNTHGERDRKAEWMESKPCIDCIHDAENKAAAEATKEAAPLEGSDKQIAWATSIRAKAIKQAQDTLGNIDNMPATDEWKATMKAQGTAIIEAMMQETSARVIIDNRDNLIMHYQTTVIK